jgi:hypothetical protein
MVVIAVFLVPVSARAGDLKHFKGVLTELYYAEEADLRTVDRRVSIRWLKDRPSNIKELSLPGVVSRKFDVIRMNVERVLDMYPRGSIVSFNVLRDQDAVEEVLLKKFGNKKSYEAFYSKRDKHIYLAADRANTNKVAHELAHAVVDLELGSAVPETVHEILAKYVDAHLYD